MASSQKLTPSALARRREIARVWNLLHPKPIELRKGRRRFLREGPLKQWSPVQKRVKKKYVFLFSDCLLITRKDSPHRYWMKIFCFLSSIKDIQFVPGQAYAKVPDVEFRVVTAKKTLIFFGASKTETDTWIRDLNYARGGCKGPAPPSVWQYGDEETTLDGQEDDIDISSVDGVAPIGSADGAPPAVRTIDVPPVTPFPVAAATGPSSGPKPDDLILIDFSGASVAFNPFVGSAPPTSSSGSSAAGAGFDPFGLGAAAGASGPGSPVGSRQGASGPGGFDTNFLFGMGPSVDQYGHHVDPSGMASPHMSPHAAHGAPTMAAAPAPIFLPDAAQGAAQVASDLVRYLEQMPPGLHNPSIIAATQAAKDASARLQQAIMAFNANPNPETGRLLQQAAAEAAVLVSKLMGEATFVAESQPPDDYKRQLAAAVHLTALSLEQLVNASSLALDHYTQQEHQRAMMAAQAEAQQQAEARARAEAERAQQAMLVAQQQAAFEAQQAEARRAAELSAALDAEREAARQLAAAQQAEQLRLVAAQQAQMAAEEKAREEEANRAMHESMAQMHAAMESVALSIAASAEKLAAAAAAAAERAATAERAIPVGGSEIVSGTSAIASLTAGLIRVATEAQAEVTRRMGSTVLATGARYHDDPVWREGLISAARDVGSNIELLVTAASEATEHDGPLEMLIASLRQVNGAVARLVSAARAKMSPDSSLLPKLAQAASSVRQASIGLEQTAASATKERAALAAPSPSPADIEKSPSATAAMRERMEKLAEVARLEKQLEEARKRVALITKSQYEQH